MTKSETTLCAWCGQPIANGKIIYKGETICYECYGESLKDKRKVAKMQKQKIRKEQKRELGNFI